jgi:hypothetical protein
LDDRTRELLLDAAGAFGLKPAAYARVIVRRHLHMATNDLPIRRRVLHAELLQACLAELGKQGSNLNQLAKAANRSDRHATEAITVMQDRYTRTLDAVCDALGVGADP